MQLNNSDPEFQEIALLEGSGEFEAGLEKCNSFIARNPDHDEIGRVYFYRGVFNGRLNNFEAALADFDRALKQEELPERVIGFIHYTRGTLYGQSGQHAEALADFDRALDRGFLGANVFYARGSAHHNLDDHEDAIADFSESISRDGKFSLAFFWRGHVQMQLGRIIEAEQDFEKALELDPNNSDARVNLNELRADRGEHNQARFDYEQAIEDSPHNALFYLGKGKSEQAMAKQGDIGFSDAKRSFDKAIELDSTLAEAYAARARVQIQQAERNAGNSGRDPITAIRQLDALPQVQADYDRAIELAPGNAEFYARRGALYYLLDAIVEAEQDIKQATQLDPSNAKTLELYGDLLAGEDRFQEALDAYAMAARMGNAMVLQDIIRVYEAMQINVSQLALDSLRDAQSYSDVQAAVYQYPFMMMTQFLTSVGIIITQQVPQNQKAKMGERLEWLRHLIAEGYPLTEAQSSHIHLPPKSRPSPASQPNLHQLAPMTMEVQALSFTDPRKAILKATECIAAYEAAIEAHPGQVSALRLGLAGVYALRAGSRYNMTQRTLDDLSDALQDVRSTLEFLDQSAEPDQEKAPTRATALDLKNKLEERLLRYGGPRYLG